MISISNALGFSLVYASAYFLPLLTHTQAYLLKPATALQVGLLPTLATVAVGSTVIWAATLAVQHYAPSRVTTAFTIALCTMMSVVALKGIAEAAGYHWQDSIPRGHDMLATQQRFRFIAVLIVFLLVLFQRAAMPKLVRLLGSLGFAFGILAVVRLISMSVVPSPDVAQSNAAASSPMQVIRSQHATPLSAGERPRRVVWAIFDETDFDLALGSDKAVGLQLPNFDQLAQMSVLATHANSPASATLYSVPALLTGIPISGKGVRIDRAGELSVESSNGTITPLNEGTSIFGVLQKRGMTASVLGFHHPYCQLFELQRCDRLVWPQAGSVSEALMANIPDYFSNRRRLLDQWSIVTRESIRLLPEYLSRDDALTFLHFNVPHLPAEYADAEAHLAPSGVPLVEYSRNLKLADRILGDIVSSMQKQAPDFELLLIVSSDHWLRNRWYQADEREVARPVPLIMWKIGETQGIALTNPVSTVHTAEMILSYLQGDVTDQSQIADWWQNQVFFSSFIAPDT